MRPLNVDTQTRKNVVDKERDSKKCEQTSVEVDVVAANEVKIMKSSLKNKRSGKTSMGKRSKKRVRFSDSEPAPATGITLCERFVRFFHFLWKFTRRSVKIVLSKFPFIV